MSKFNLTEREIETVKAAARAVWERIGDEYVAKHVTRKASVVSRLDVVRAVMASPWLANALHHPQAIALDGVQALVSAWENGSRPDWGGVNAMVEKLCREAFPTANYNRRAPQPVSE